MQYIPGVFGIEESYIMIYTPIDGVCATATACQFPPTHLSPASCLKSTRRTRQQYPEAQNFTPPITMADAQFDSAL